MSKEPLLSSVNEREIELKELESGRSGPYQPFPVSFSPASPPIDAEKAFLSRLERSFGVLKLEAGSELETCTRTMSVILENVIKNPTEEKFRKIKLQNQKFHREVGKFPSSIDFFEVMGFQRVRLEEECLVYFLENTDPLTQALDLIKNPPKPPPPKALAKPVQVQTQPAIPSFHAQRANFLAEVHAKRVATQTIPKSSASRNFLKKDKLPPTSQATERPQTSARDPNWANDVLYHINNLRAMHRLAPLSLSSPLADLAQEHSVRMSNFEAPFGHDGFNERISRVPFKTIRAATENVAITQDQQNIGQSVVTFWSMNPAYMANLLGAFNVCGIGVAQGKEGSFYVTLLILAV
eukprot:CAMPEP_0204897166 /NCGR_PEP_ID=MMETSP1397-20131031/582_1 /ASSEMBLY_ACC=CAM_ASM_000891 /TAXON_ID=49980 /ORGANISM="Climacostomum Climacostomum virens, Strain Stock W-24" /LENGTH=351 /DNA_ID=CAMNT_0052064881 /DNA_START=562 /DNA_END=1617 /DNA_ORIENTATION=+